MHWNVKNKVKTLTSVMNWPMIESSIPCVLIPPSLFMFVENFQCFELVLEQKWKQRFICFFSSIIVGLSSTLILPSPSEMALSEPSQFLTVIQKGLGGRSCIAAKMGNKSVCAPHQLRGELQTEVFASSPAHTGHQGAHEADFFVVYLYSAFVNPQYRRRYPMYWGSTPSLLPSALKLTVQSDCLSLQPVIWRLLQILDPFGARYFQFQAPTYLFMTGFILTS